MRWCWRYLQHKVLKAFKAYSSANCLVSCQANPQWPNAAVDFYLLVYTHGFDGLSLNNLLWMHTLNTNLLFEGNLHGRFARYLNHLSAILAIIFSLFAKVGLSVEASACKRNYISDKMLLGLHSLAVLTQSVPTDSPTLAKSISTSHLWPLAP